VSIASMLHRSDVVVSYNHDSGAVNSSAHIFFRYYISIQFVFQRHIFFKLKVIYVKIWKAFSRKMHFTIYYMRRHATSFYIYDIVYSQRCRFLDNRVLLGTLDPQGGWVPLWGMIDKNGDMMKKRWGYHELLMRI
jgi:hypothetical protein